MQHWQLRGIQSILHGHEGIVNAVKFFPTGPSYISILLSGAADNSLRIWRTTREPELKFERVQTLKGHQGAITRIATLPGSNIFATGAADGTVKIWKLVHDAEYSAVNATLLQTISLSPRYFPLSIALATLDDLSTILAIAGTRSTIQIYVSQDTHFHLSATLTGHEGWIRSLDFTHENSERDGDLLLASASQDKYIRLWRIHRGAELPAVSSALSDPSLGVLGKSLSNKAHRIASSSSEYSITFEALLLGHEDWIYSSSWRRRGGKLQLLSTSEDNSLAIWEADPTSGVWICITRLGEISAQKGSTSATGSAGGFWIGVWSPDSNSIVSLGRTGSWRRWTYSATEDMWKQQVGITGHVREVKDLCWSRDGSYLLSTGSDQTTRLFSEWKRDECSSWHEFSRPQIHGYDLNCIDCVNNVQFVSGADEKLLRVFDEPRGVSEMLNRLCNIEVASVDLPDAANIPVLGLSNKAIQAVSDEELVEYDDTHEHEPVDPAALKRKSTLDLNHPPFEDQLARHLLWPETEKLYGHGYEISALAISNDGRLVATTCRASSIEHAVIRLYDTKEWLELRPPLRAHSLTVTALQFSCDDRYLLSVGRDRQWVVWERTADAGYELRYSDPKGHSRMILGASWTALQQPTFLTAGRDKIVRIWQLTDQEMVLKGSAMAIEAVTAVACSPNISQGRLWFAFGTDAGKIYVCFAETKRLDEVTTTNITVDMAPAKTINQIAWRPARSGSEQQIAVASDDSSVRIFTISI
jgi:elongator complex protein 2